MSNPYDALGTLLSEEDSLVFRASASNDDPEAASYLGRIVGGHHAILEHHDHLSPDSLWFQRAGDFHLRIHYDNLPVSADQMMDIADASEYALNQGCQDHLVTDGSNHAGISVRAKRESNGKTAKSVHTMKVSLYQNGMELVSLVRKINADPDINLLEAGRLQALRERNLADVTAPAVYRVGETCIWTECITGNNAREGFGRDKQRDLFRMADACIAIQDVYREIHAPWMDSILVSPHRTLQAMGVEHERLSHYLSCFAQTSVPDCRPDNFFLREKCIKIDEGGVTLGLPYTFIAKMCDFDDTISEKERDVLIAHLNPPDLIAELLGMYANTLQSALKHKESNPDLYKHRMRRAKGYLLRITQADTGWSCLEREFSQNYSQ